MSVLREDAEKKSQKRETEKGNLVYRGLDFVEYKGVAKHKDKRNTGIFLQNLFSNFWRFIFNLHFVCVCSVQKEGSGVTFSNYRYARTHTLHLRTVL